MLSPVGVTCPFHQAPVIEATNRHVMERAFSFDIAGDSSLVNDSPRTGSAIEFCHHVIYIVCLVFCLASLRKLRRNCWSRAKRNYNSSRSEYRLHDGNLLQTSTFETLPVQMSALPPKADIGIGSLRRSSSGNFAIFRNRAPHQATSVCH